MGNQASSENEQEPSSSSPSTTERSSPTEEEERSSPSGNNPAAEAKSSSSSSDVDSSPAVDDQTSPPSSSDDVAVPPPPPPSSPTVPPRKILIAGAGPGGLLTAIFLLRRNATLPPSAPKYHVTVVDPGVDYGSLTSEGLKRHRSWMIGLSAHGLNAIRRIPDLYDDYIRTVGLTVRHAVTGFGKYTRKVKVEDLNLSQDAFIVDRNYIVAGLARYLNDKWGDKEEELTTMYGTRAVFVDGENKRVLVRDQGGREVVMNSGMTSAGGGGGGGTGTGTSTSTEGGAEAAGSDQYLGYDLLIGADGIRSVVRNAFVATHRDFEFDLKGLFGSNKSVHVPLPDDVEDGTFMMLINCIPNGTAFVLPETGQMLNIGLGYMPTKPLHPDLHSDDPKVVSAYFKANFTAFNLDCDLMAKEWVAQSWNTLSMVHCNKYHSSELSAILLGDAAHATSPAIGQGMNTALADAEALNDLIDKLGDDELLGAVLPAFSDDRVKEGNALTDLSYYSMSLSPLQQLSIMIRQGTTDLLHRWMPSMVDWFPMTSIGVEGMKLSVAYDKMIKLGVIQRVRCNNDAIVREYFEKKVGMVKDQQSRNSGMGLVYVGGVLVAAIMAGIAYASLGGKRGYSYSSLFQ